MTVMAARSRASPPWNGHRAYWAALPPRIRVSRSREIADRTGLYKSTILRLCESLRKFGYIVRLGNGRFVLGGAIFRLGQTINARSTSVNWWCPF